MPRFVSLQKSPQRHRGGDSVPSTFPEHFERAHGDPTDDTDALLDEITIVLAEHEHSHEHDHAEARRHLGHLGLETKRPE